MLMAWLFFDNVKNGVVAAMKGRGFALLKVLESWSGNEARAASILEPWKAAATLSAPLRKPE